MNSILPIKEEYLLRGITNTFLAEKAGITPAQLFGLDSDDQLSRKAVFQRVVQVINKNEVGFPAENNKMETELFSIAEV